MRIHIGCGSAKREGFIGLEPPTPSGRKTLRSYAYKLLVYKT